MRLGGLVMLLVAGCQFQVAGTSGGGALPDLAAPGVIPVGPDPVAPVLDLATAPSIADLAAPPKVDVDMATREKDSAVGTACKVSSECGGGGLVCVEAVGAGKTQVQFPGGHCTRDCTNSACPTDSVCTKLGGGFNICMAKCPPASCRVGYRCCAAESVCAPADSCE